MTINLVTYLVLCCLIAGLLIQVGVASWNLRRAGRYRRQRNAAEHKAEILEQQVEHITEKFRALDKYTTEVAWLLKFLYGKYEKFADIDKAISELTKSGENSLDLDEFKSAAKLIRVTLRATDSINGYVNSIAPHIHSIIRELESLDEKETSEVAETNSTETSESTEKEGDQSKVN